MFNNIQYAEIWNECLGIAITAFNHGSMGISAIVTDTNFQIISRGRNHLSLNDDSKNQIYGSSVAHAEINAINNLKQKSLAGKDLILFTTVEPCPMCMGAIIMSRIRNVIIASKDPHAGSMEYINFSKYTKDKNIKILYMDGKVEKAFFIIHYLSILRVMKDRRPHIIFDNMRREYAKYMEIIEKNMIINKIEKMIISKDQINNIVEQEN
jgi:tRNA(Arg) A34 adenosine deaminase TadA